MDRPEKKPKVDTDDIINQAMTMSCDDIQNLQERLKCIENSKKDIRLQYIKHVQKWERDAAFEMVQQYPWLLNETFGLVGDDGIEKPKDYAYYTWLTWEITKENNKGWSPEMILKLLEAGADPNITTTDPDGNIGNALRTFMEVVYDRKKSFDRPDYAQSHLEVAANLLKYNVQVDPKPEDDEVSPFQMSVGLVYRNPNISFFKDLMYLLIKNGANVNHKDYDGDNALHRIIESCDDDANAINLLKLLLQLNVKINEQNINDETPLMNAVEYNKLRIAKVLLENGAAMDIKDWQGKTAFDYCKKEECKNLLRSFSTRRWSAKWGKEGWDSSNKQDFFMKDLIPKLQGYLQLDDCSPENMQKIATTNYQIDTGSDEWMSFSNKTKCWILKNMLSGYNYDQAKINWDAAVAQERLNKLDFSEHETAFGGISGEFVPTIDVDFSKIRKGVEEQRRKALNTKRGVFFDK